MIDYCFKLPEYSPYTDHDNNTKKTPVDNSMNIGEASELDDRSLN